MNGMTHPMESSRTTSRAAMGHPITIAVLWDAWRDKQAGETVKSCAMVMTEAKEFVAEVHDRMPAMLERDQFEAFGKGWPPLPVVRPSNSTSLCERIRPHSKEQSLLESLPARDEFQLTMHNA
jgi:hypothetical protein